jgi:hypothetical protein
MYSSSKGVLLSKEWLTISMAAGAVTLGLAAVALIVIAIVFTR